MRSKQNCRKFVSIDSAATMAPYVSFLFQNKVPYPLVHILGGARYWHLRLTRDRLRVGCGTFRPILAVTFPWTTLFLNQIVFYYLIIAYFCRLFVFLCR